MARSHWTIRSDYGCRSWPRRVSSEHRPAMMWSRIRLITGPSAHLPRRVRLPVRLPPPRPVRPPVSELKQGPPQPAAGCGAGRVDGGAGPYSTAAPAGRGMAGHLLGHPRRADRPVSGRPLPEFLAERLFGPLGMADTGFEVPASSLTGSPSYYRTGPAVWSWLTPPAGSGAACRRSPQGPAAWSPPSMTGTASPGCCRLRERLRPPAALSCVGAADDHRPADPVSGRCQPVVPGGLGLGFLLLGRRRGHRPLERARDATAGSAAPGTAAHVTASTGAVANLAEPARTGLPRPP